jgi:hypothetical protein
MNWYTQQARNSTRIGLSQTTSLVVVLPGQGRSTKFFAQLKPVSIQAGALLSSSPSPRTLYVWWSELGLGILRGTCSATIHRAWSSVEFWKHGNGPAGDWMTQSEGERFHDRGLLPASLIDVIRMTLQVPAHLGAHHARLSRILASSAGLQLVSRTAAPEQDPPYMLSMGMHMALLCPPPRHQYHEPA